MFVITIQTPIVSLLRVARTREDAEAHIYYLAKEDAPDFKISPAAYCGVQHFQDASGRECELCIYECEYVTVPSPATVTPTASDVPLSEAVTLLQRALDYERDAFESDEPISGADLTDWFVEWRRNVDKFMDTLR